MVDPKETIGNNLTPDQIEEQLDDIEQHPLTPKEVSKYYRDPQNHSRIRQLGNILNALHATHPSSEHHISQIQYFPSAETLAARLDEARSVIGSTEYVVQPSEPEGEA